MWALVFVVVLSNGISQADTVDIVDSMSECFDRRDSILVEMGAWDGYFELGHQAICIPLEVE